MAADDAYLRGYLDGLLDNRFPSLGLKVHTLDAQGLVQLSARNCPGPSQQRDIEELLIATGRVRTVVWDAATDCARPSTASSPFDVSLLSEEELFAPLLADPRQPRFSMSYQRYRTPTQHFRAAGVAFGEYFPIATGVLGRSGASQIGIQGAVFALFNLDAPSSDLVNADYSIGIPLSYRRGPWSTLFKIYHQSSHLGDEFLLGNAGINRLNLSYEDMLGLVSHEWERWRVYGGVGYLLRSEPALDPGHWQAGIEYVRPHAFAGLDFIAAADVKAAQELDWSRSRSYQAGFEFRRNTPRRLRLMLEYFRGHSPNGQFYREKLSYVGVGVYFRF